MYINDVVRHVMNVYPSEYDAGEMYKWCDEVSSMLITEDRNIYRRVVLPVSPDGTILLPEGVRQEYVDKVVAGGDILDYTDYRTYGDRDIYIRGRNGIRLENKQSLPKCVTVDYREQYHEIRMIKYDGPVQATPTSIHTYPVDFIAGDTVNATITGTSTETQEEETYTFTEVPIIEANMFENKELSIIDTLADGDTDSTQGFQTGDILMDFRVPNGTFTGASSLVKQTAKIQRCITERTVCDAPFDQMYIEFVLAKIRLYQNDTQGYNTYMTMFNSHLAAYREWPVKRMPPGDNRIRNWW